MFGELEHELELHVPASEAWDLFGTLRIGQLVAKELPHLFQSVELTEGDGGVGTVLKLTFAPGHSLLSFFILIVSFHFLIYVYALKIPKHMFNTLFDRDSVHPVSDTG